MEIKPKYFTLQVNSSTCINFGKMEKSYTFSSRVEKKIKLLIKLNEDTINREAKKWRNICTYYIDFWILHYFWLSRILLLKAIQKILHQKIRGNFIELVKMMANYGPIMDRKEYLLIYQKVSRMNSLLF